MEEGQEEEQAVLRSVTAVVDRGPGVRLDVAMGQRRSLRLACRARGVEDRGGIARIHGPGGSPWWVPGRPVEGRLALAFADDDVLECGQVPMVDGFLAGFCGEADAGF